MTEALLKNPDFPVTAPALEPAPGLEPAPIVDAPRPAESLAGWRSAAARRVFIRDLRLDASIGVHPHEREAAQPVTFCVEMEVAPAGAAGRDGAIVFAPPPRPDDAAAQDVVCYESVSLMIQRLLEEGHIDYVESLVDRVADECLSDSRVLSVSVRAEKPNAIKSAAAVGVEILKRR